MDTLTVLCLSNGILLLAVGALVALLRRTKYQVRHGIERHAERLRQIQQLRDTQHGWLLDGTPSDVESLQQSIARLTPLKSWWLDCHAPVVTEEQVAHAPFFIEPRLASMALRLHHTVHQHQLAQWGWASTYIPVQIHDQSSSLLILASPSDLSAADHAFAVAMAEMLCYAWTHTMDQHIASST